MKNRIFSLKFLSVYLISVGFLVFISDSQEKLSFRSLLGGISHETFSSGINTYEVFCWNIGVLPPLTLSILYIMEEVGDYSIYTLIRTRTTRMWWNYRWLTIVWLNVSYIFVVLGVTDIQSLYSWSDLGEISLFLLHTCSVSFLLVTILVLIKSLKFLLISYGVIEVLLVVVGDSYPAIQKYLFPFWAMAKNKSYLGNQQEIHNIIVVLSSILLMIWCYCVTIIGTKGKFPLKWREN